MKKKEPELIDDVLWFFAKLALWFILVTAFFCAIGFMARDAERVVTFSNLLWDGTIAFWFGPAGLLIFLALFGVIVRYGWKLLWEGFAFKERQAGLDKEVEAQVKRRVEGLIPIIEEETRKSVELELAVRAGMLLEEEENMRAQHKRLWSDREGLELARQSLRAEQAKTERWLKELKALQQKEIAAKERRVAVKQRIRWGLEALSANPPNIGLSMRHLRKAEKL